MMSKKSAASFKRFGPDAGIAIGPILFIVAILAVLVGALAAGDSGFSTSITTESARVNATTVVEQGNNLQSAMDRVLSNGASPSEIYVVSNISASGGNLSTQEQESALFAPSGGGLTYPTPPAAMVPASTPNAWDFVSNATLLGVGVGTGEYVAVLPILNQTSCAAINSVVFGQNSTQASTIPEGTTATVVAPTAGTGTLGTSDSTSVAPSGNAFDDTGATSLSGSPQGCLKVGSGYYYYQLLISN